jgi:hypothetical protein
MQPVFRPAIEPRNRSRSSPPGPCVHRCESFISSTDPIDSRFDPGSGLLARPPCSSVCTSHSEPLQMLSGGTIAAAPEGSLDALRCPQTGSRTVDVRKCQCGRAGISRQGSALGHLAHNCQTVRGGSMREDRRLGRMTGPFLCPPVQPRAGRHPAAPAAQRQRYP